MTDTAVNSAADLAAPSGPALDLDTEPTMPNLPEVTPTLPGATPAPTPSNVSVFAETPAPEPVPPTLATTPSDTSVFAETATPEAAEPVADVAMLLDDQAMPTLPDAVATGPAEVADPLDDTDADQTKTDHPMGHLMPAKSKPSEASRKAAEQRAAKKAKGRKIKIGLAVVFLAIAAAAGPPAFSWLSDAINEAGDTSVEEPED